MDKVTRFLCARRLRSTIVETRAQRARRAPPAIPQQGNMNQGQAAPQAQQAAPPAQPADAAAPPVLPAPPAPLPVPPAPPAFALGPGRSHAILNFDDPNTGATATKLYNKAIAPLEAKFDGEADNLADLPGQRTRSGTALQLAPAHHCAHRRRHNQEPSHSLRPSIVGQHQGTCGHLREHADQGRARQRYVLLLFVGLAHERVPHNGAPLRGRLHRHERASRSLTPKTNHHPHQGGQPRLYNAHQRNAHRI